MYAASAAGGVSASGNATATVSAHAWHLNAPLTSGSRRSASTSPKSWGRLNDVTGKVRKETARHEQVVAELKGTLARKKSAKVGTES
jgi:hypothetical protein